MQIRRPSLIWVPHRNTTRILWKSQSQPNVERIFSQTVLSTKTKCELNKHAFELIVHTDICGQFREAIFGGERYFVIMTTLANMYIHVVPIPNKASAHNLCINYMVRLERSTGTTTNGINWKHAKKSSALNPKLATLRIRRTTTHPYSSQSSQLLEQIDSAVMNKVPVISNRVNWTQITK